MVQDSTEALHESPLKVPAVEVIDLSTEANTVEPLASLHRNKGEDASVDVNTDEDEDEDEDDDDEWSLYEDAIGGMENEGLPLDSLDACTTDETLAFRRHLRLVGEDRFLVDTIEARRISAKKLVTAFGIRPPAFLEGAPDEAFYPLLGLAISRELSRRVKLPQYNTIDDAVSLLKRSRNIVVITGAGISTSLGIPDFRSKDTGLYAQLEHLGLGDPQEVFDISLFRDDPTIFYSVAKDILPSTNRFSPTHAFIRLLQEKDKLLTNFTQNIDNLEEHAGVLPEKLIQCHGSFATASCVECKYRVKGSEIHKDLKAGRVARCDRCLSRLRSMQPGGLKRKRSSNGTLTSNKKKRQDYEDSSDEEDYEIAIAGVMKPDITFFGEALPPAFHDRLIHHDRDLVDLVLVIGTSLKVAPVSEVIGILPPDVPQIYISREPCKHVDFDIDLLGDCDVVVAELCRRADWDLEHEMIPKDNKIDVELYDGHESRYSIRVSALLDGSTPASCM